MRLLFLPDRPAKKRGNVEQTIMDDGTIVPYPIRFMTKLFSVVGRSGSGKTTLITRILPLFVQRGLKVGSIKHTHHRVELDKKGKDSWKHAQAGSSQVLLLTHDQMAVFRPLEERPRLPDLCRRWFPDFDLVISEGFKNEDCLKVEITRQANPKPPLYTDPAFQIDAVVSDTPIDTPLPKFDIDEIESLTRWLAATLKL